MDDSNNLPSGGTAELTLRGAANLLQAERNKEPDTPVTRPDPVSPQAQQQEDTPDPADLAALDAAEDEPTEATQQEQPPKVRLKDGTEVTFDELEEWRKGTLRQADYTKKTQELAEQRKKFEADFSQFQQQSQTHAQAIDQAIALVQHFMPQPPSDDLRKQDIFAWTEAKAEYDAQVGRLQSLMTQKAQIEHMEGQKRQQALMDHYRQQQESLYSARPELKDPVKATKFWEDVKSLGSNLGFKAEEMAQISDYRLLLMADKAVKYDRLMAHKAKLADKAKDAAPMAPPVQSPGRRQSTAERESAALAPLRQRFEQSGNLRDAARLLTAERARGSR